MKAVILTAGAGTRMRPLTLETPKPLLSYGGKSHLDRLFEALPSSIEEVILTVDYLKEKIKSHCGNEFHGRKIYYAEGNQKGNAFGFLAAKQYLENENRFAILYGDELLTRKEMEDCLSHPFSWLCYESKAPTTVGIALVDEKGIITDVIEKPKHPPSNLAADGFMVTGPKIFEYRPIVHTNGECYVSELMAQFAKNHQVHAVIGDPEHMQLTSPADIDFLNTIFSK